MLVHAPVNGTWPKPLAALDVIEPVWCVVLSSMTICRPCAVSCKVTTSLSPEFMNRSADGLGVKVLMVESSGFGGELGCGWPLFVMKAKFTGSIPTSPMHAPGVLVTGSSERLSILSAAHHLVGSQLLPPGHSTQPGG